MAALGMQSRSIWTRLIYQVPAQLVIELVTCLINILLTVPILSIATAKVGNCGQAVHVLGQAADNIDHMATQLRCTAREYSSAARQQQMSLLRSSYHNPLQAQDSLRHMAIIPTHSLIRISMNMSSIYQPPHLGLHLDSCLAAGVSLTPRHALHKIALVSAA